MTEPRASTSTDLVLLGGPGSGKGTQAAHVAAKLGVPHISTGDLFRENLRRETELGGLAKGFMDKGELVPDDLTEAMVKDRLERPDAIVGFVLDGFPRTRAQAEALDELLHAAGRSLIGALQIEVSDDEIVRRLSGRLVCRSCGASSHVDLKPQSGASGCDVCGGELYQRDDDRPETVAARLRIYHSHAGPLSAYYRDLGVLRVVDGEGTPDEVTSRVLAAAEALLPGAAPPS